MVSVILPVLDGEATLGAQLEALSRQRFDGDWEVIVADNGSADATVEIAQGWVGRIPGLRVVDASVHRDAATARNIGVREAHGDLLLFCDADDVVGPGWMAAFTAERAGWHLAGGAIDYSELNPPGAAPRGRVLPGPGQLGWLPFVASANLAVHRPVFESVGGFQDGLGGVEDMDFCWRAQLAGYRLGVVPNALVAKRTRTDPRILYRQHVTFGRASAAMFRRYRQHGMPRTSTVQALRTYAWLALRTRHLGDLDARREWARLAGVRWGRVVASVQTRTLYL